MRWSLEGTEQQNAIVADALRRCDFPFERYGDAVVPVEWDDLSRYATASAAETREVAPSGPFGAEVRHHGDAHDEDGYDVLAFRSRVLGLAWYSGKITLERTLVNEPELAAEVFLSEGAHMVDFENIGGMTDAERVAIWNAVHPPEQHLAPDADVSDGVNLGHDHGWFDVGGYYAWVGEAWMGLFTRAFSDVAVTIEFDHPATEEAAAEIRRAFLPPEPAPYFGVNGSDVYHDSHGGIRRDIEFVAKEHAERAYGRRPCGVCKP